MGDGSNDTVPIVVDRLMGFDNSSLTSSVSTVRLLNATNSVTTYKKQTSVFDLSTLPTNQALYTLMSATGDTISIQNGQYSTIVKLVKNATNFTITHLKSDNTTQISTSTVSNGYSGNVDGIDYMVGSLTAQVVSTSASSMDITVVQGWNLIGAGITGTIVQNNTIFTGPIYSYNSNRVYTEITNRQVVAGQGYFINCLTAGTITISKN